MESLIYNPETMKKLPEINFPTFCKELRELAGYTQQEMADRLETNLVTYQRWEYDLAKPNGTMTAKLFFLRDEILAQVKRRAKSSKNQPV